MRGGAPGPGFRAGPGRRTEKAVVGVDRKFKRRDKLGPGADPVALQDLVHWPHARAPVLVVGQQPTLGQVIAKLLGLAEDTCPVKKGAVWWLHQRERDGVAQTVLLTVQTPELQ